MLNGSYENRTTQLDLESQPLLPNNTNAIFLNINQSSQNSTIPILDSYVDRHVIGMALALGGNLLISISLNVQKKAHNRLGQESQMKYCVDKWWWLGMVLMGVGEGGNFMAYGFAPASLVAPLGSLGVIANAVIAVVFLHEPLTMPSMVGVTFVVVGSIILVSFSVKGKSVLTSSEILSYLQTWPFIVYVSVETVLFTVLLYLKYVRGKEYLVVLLLLVAVVASVTIIAAKAVSTMISETLIQGINHILNPIFFVSLAIIPVTTFTQIRFLNRAMQLYNVSDVVPVNFMFFTTSAILAGAMFYREFYQVQFDQVFMFLFGVVQSIVGVYIITKGNGFNKENEPQIQDDHKDANHCDVGPGSSGCKNEGQITDVSDEVSGNQKETLSRESSPKAFPNCSNKRSSLELNSETKSSGKNTLANLLIDILEKIKNSEKISKVQPFAKDIK